MEKSPIPVIDIKKYGGKQVAIADGKIVATGRTLEEVIRRVKKLSPSRSLQEVKMFSVPKTLSVIYIYNAYNDFRYWWTKIYGLATPN